MLKLNRKILAVAVIVSIISLIISSCGKQEEGIVAKVNGDVITEEEFNQEFEVIKKVRQKQLGEDILSQEMGDNKIYEEVLKENVLDMLINEKIIAREIEDMNITITDKEVEEAIKTYYIDELGGEEKYKEFLKNNGFTEETLKRGLKRKLIYEKHREDFINKTNLTEDEVKKYFEENKSSFIKFRVSHILVKTEEEGNKILKRLKNAEDFHSLVATESADGDSAVQGGDLGYFTKDTLLEAYKPLGDAASDLEIGETSGLIKTELGYHIILLEDRKDSYEDLKEDIIPILKNERYAEKISDLRDEANIKIYMKEDKTEEKEK